jgi:outer membrane protein insertion porin family
VRSIGPVDQMGRLLGGNKFVLGNAEYYFDLFGPIRFLFFFDAGQAYLEGEKIDLGQLKLSTGAELRFVMPVLNVPFRLIYAYNPNPLVFTPKTTFKFAVGTTF